MQLTGLITGTLGYSLKRDFLANSIAFREVETFNYEIYSVDFSGLSANTIQSQIKNQFLGIYSGDVQVSVFNTQNSYQFPSDSIRASKFNVTVEIKKPVVSLSTMFPELASSYYKGIDSSFWTTNGKYLLDFKESYSFATNQNGNREFNHDLAFGLQTGFANSSTQSGRKSFAQSLASGIFASDKDTSFGIATMAGAVSSLADSGQFRNYYNESYDLIKNSYGFSRKREILPFDGSNSVFNLNNAINMNVDGTIDVSEKATVQGKIDFSSTKSNLDYYLTSSYGRCSGVYSKFYNTGIILGDSIYSGNGLTNSNLLPLVNTPTKTVKTYDSRSLAATYEVVYTNNPSFMPSGVVVSQDIEFNIDSYNKVEATHSYDFLVNRVKYGASFFLDLMNSVTGRSPSTIDDYYSSSAFSEVKSQYPEINLVKTSASWPNIKPKASVRLSYSNNPSYFLNVYGVDFRILDYTVEQTRPVDVVNEYKVINRPTKKSVLSYGYQTEKGQVSVNIKASLGKQSHQFAPDGVGDFSSINGLTLIDYLQAIYKFAGQTFLSKFGFPTMAFNWFISDSKYSFDSDGNLSVQLTYVYTLKKRLSQ